jgi:tellurite resistance protein
MATHGVMSVTSPTSSEAKNINSWQRQKVETTMRRVHHIHRDDLMTEILRLARRNKKAQNVLEYALTLAVILVIGAGSIWFIEHAITNQ